MQEVEAPCQEINKIYFLFFKWVLVLNKKEEVTLNLDNFFFLKINFLVRVILFSIQIVDNCEFQNLTKR